MIEKITGKNVLIYFNGYGCYCGKDGKGKPRDEIDMCCFNHSCCYDRLDFDKCHPLIEHYNFLIVNDDVRCENEEKSRCPTWVCECDREASLCFRRKAKTYNKFFHHYPAVLCTEATPKCPADLGLRTGISGGDGEILFWGGADMESPPEKPLKATRGDCQKGFRCLGNGEPARGGRHGEEGSLPWDTGGKQRIELVGLWIVFVVGL
ncbi:basic phospholipase A2-like [Sphaerodactylus townsendi]|uniref:basic phospholipase A2-like n=1 Tax=Sphaerodactylus townsendi TaxID=933632 RepID=UPI0020264575|nr:basic phospholipase A2-like [Sphaerodactylus townsendi]